MAGVAVNLFMIYQFLKRLVTPFKDWDAFKFGIIDKDGNILKKTKTLKTMEERNSLRTFDIMILKLKRLLEKAPGGKTRLASLAAALWLIKESEKPEEDIILEDVEESFMAFLEENTQYIQENYIDEESTAPTNVVGTGAIAGAGPGDDPPKKKKKKKCDIDKIMKRKNAKW